MTRCLLGENTTLSEQIIDHIATLENTDPLELPPLFDAVDPDALEALFADHRIGTVEFPYAGYTVTVEVGDESTITIA